MARDSGSIIFPEDWKSFIGDVSATNWVVVCDENTALQCLPYFQEKYLPHHAIITLQIQAGEQHKSLTQVEFIWHRLLELGIDRNAMIIALGGGQVCDLAGFAASTYKRGTPLINVPTTNLAMCDAALGGKTGFNLRQIKNQIGTFFAPEAVLIDSHFLKTLPEAHLRSGFAETIKHALIADKPLWDQMRSEDWSALAHSQHILAHSAGIKTSIVAKDPEDQHERHALNFGHTLGHAIETASHIENVPLLHGEAVAIGMVGESWLSNKLCGLPDEALQNICDYLTSLFSLEKELSVSSIIEHARSDKKNSHGHIRCSLIANIGEPKVKVEVEEPLLADSLKFAFAQFRK